MSDQISMDISPSPSIPSPLENVVRGQTQEPQAINSVKPGIRLREDDSSFQNDLEEPPSKRIKAVDSASPGPLNQGSASQDASQAAATATDVVNSLQGPRLTDEEHALAERVLSEIIGLPTAQPFLEPVDPVSAKAPNYYQVITQPMDLGTIRKRLASSKEQTTTPSRTPYRTLQGFVDDVELVFSNCFKYNGPSHAISALALQLKQTFEKGMAGRNLKFQTLPATPTLSPLETPSSTEGGIPKRRLNYPPRNCLPTVATRPNRRNPLRIAQDKFCKLVLDHLFRPEYQRWTLPFRQPVDLDEYPDYLARISKPMDLRTIRDKYSHGAYGTAEEFRADMKLMFSNCYEYNPSWAPVWQFGKELEKVFDEKWKELPTTVPEASTDPLPKKKRSSTGSTAAAQPSRKVDPKKPSAKMQYKPLSEEQKIELCETLLALPNSKIEQVIEQIIRRRLPQYRENDETVMLDFDDLPAEVQSEMYEFLKPPKEQSKYQSIFASDSSDLSSEESDDA